MLLCYGCDVRGDRINVENFQPIPNARWRYLFIAVAIIKPNSSATIAKKKREKNYGDK